MSAGETEVVMVCASRLVRRGSVIQSYKVIL